MVVHIEKDYNISFFYLSSQANFNTYLFEKISYIAQNRPLANGLFCIVCFMKMKPVRNRHISTMLQ